VRGDLVVSVLACQFGVQIPARAESWLKISAPPAPLNKLSYDEYTVSGKMRRWGTGLATYPHIPRLRKWSR